MVTAKINPVDVLYEVLASEQTCLLNALAGVEPYVPRADVEVRRRLAQMSADAKKQEQELADLILEAGGEVPPPGVCEDYAKVAYLSLDYLLPRLVETKKQSAARCERAIAAMGEGNAAAVEVLKRHLETHRSDLEFLEKAAGGRKA